MLDDLKMIHERDAQDALGVVEKQWKQLQHQYKADVSALKSKKFKNIVLGGMGGSALAGEIAKSWPGFSLPFEIVKNYELPGYVGEDTLLIASSYSGNTEETVSALREAEKRSANIVVICAGGELAEQAEAKNYPLFEIPAGLQPRMAVFYNFAGLVQLFVQLGLVEETKLKELSEAANWLREQGKELLPAVATSQNKAKQIAQELVGNSVVIYGGPKMYPAAYKWKINFNENSKNIAWCNQLPEFNHNEFMGWSSHPVEKPYKVVDLRSSLENPRIQTRFKISEKLLSGKRPHPQIVEPQGDSLLKQLLYTIQLGDFVSIYLALLNGINPTPVDLIERLKVELKK